MPPEAGAVVPWAKAKSGTEMTPETVIRRKTTPVGNFKQCFVGLL